MCKGKEVDETMDHLHYPAEIREAARLLGYGARRDMGALLGAAVATGLNTFGRENAYHLVKVGACTAEGARRAQAKIVEFARAMEQYALREMMSAGWSVEKGVDTDTDKE